MKNIQSESEMENQRLKQTISLAKDQLEQAKLSNEKNKSEILEAKREMRENSVHSVSGLWSSDGFEDLVALSQYANPVINKLADYEETENKIMQLERSIQSPYFARIDFKFDDEDTFEKIYIGRSSLMKGNSYEMYVYDWRSPIASVFYRFVTGSAFYEAPSGRITGEVSLKRQYEINKGILEYFFDADIQIIDEFLRKLLSQNTSSKMKTIVETIQREQDVIIRDMKNDLMMVQGVAGSGKTSIALHRAAYLMYQGLSDKIFANNIIIISPNTLFEQYICNVLPELGEDNVVSVVFEEILGEILKHKRIQTRNQFLENLIVMTQYRELIKSSMEFKTSHEFIEILNRFINNLKFANPDVIKLYRELLDDEEYFYSLARGIDLPNCIEDILSFTRANLYSKVLYYDDAAVLTFMKLKLGRINPYKNIKQVVIDEAQDYYALHYEIFNLLFANAKYTILGDINQTLEKHEDMSLYKQISKILNKRKSILVSLNKSFRCTNEILMYSSKFIPHNMEIKSFNREGCKPKVNVAADRLSLSNMLISDIKHCMEKGYRTVGLICKTKKNAASLFKYLKDKIDVQLIKNESAVDLQGIFIIPVYMSKGLEFDAVLICDADNGNYHSEEDKKLLYIACTRALHRLNLFCKGEVSPLL